MNASYTVTAMSGGHDRTFGSLEAAREHAGELQGENDSLDIDIWSDVEQPELGRKQLRHEARQLANHLDVSAPLMRRLATLALYLEKG